MRYSEIGWEKMEDNHSAVRQAHGDHLYCTSSSKKEVQLGVNPATHTQKKGMPWLRRHETKLGWRRRHVDRITDEKDANDFFPFSFDHERPVDRYQFPTM